MKTSARKIILFFYVLLLFIGGNHSVRAGSIEKYSQLKQGYKQALENNENVFFQKQNKLNQRAIETLKPVADEYRAKGNVGYYIEIRKYYQLLEQNQFSAIQAEQFHCKYLVDFHEKMLVARENLSQEESIANDQIRSVMKKQLRLLVLECNQNHKPDLAQLIQAELNTFSDPPSSQ